MAEAKKWRKRQAVIEAEAPVPVLPGQGDLFEGMPAEVVTVTAAASDPVAPAAAVPPIGLPSAGQDLLSAAQATPQKRRKAPEGERKHLTTLEVDRLLAATKENLRTGLRDRCLILLMFRHGLRVTEACAMRMDQVDLESKILQVQRLKGGLSTTTRRCGRKKSGCSKAGWPNGSAGCSSGARKKAAPGQPWIAMRCF